MPRVECTSLFRLATSFFTFREQFRHHHLLVYSQTRHEFFCCSCSVCAIAHAKFKSSCTICMYEYIFECKKYVCNCVFSTYLDNYVCDTELSELAVFEANYALLSNTIVDVVDPLIKWFVDENLVTTEEEKEITNITLATEKKIRLLLQKYSSLLKDNNTRGFYVMLQIMKEQGGKGTQTLADHIMSKLKPLPDDPLQTCGDKNSSIHCKGLLNCV